MSDLSERISKLEAVQHFQTAVIGALAKVCIENPAFAAYVRENLEAHYALLLAESRDETKLSAFEELKDALLSDKSGKGT